MNQQPSPISASTTEVLHLCSHVSINDSENTSWHTFPPFGGLLVV
jgi:hypothetical protein